MNWTAFSEKLGTDVFKKYLTLEDENRQLTTANQDLSQKIEELKLSLIELDLSLKMTNLKVAEKTEELELYLAINDSTPPSKDSDEEPLPSNKAEVINGIVDAGLSSAQEIYREYKRT